MPSSKLDIILAGVHGQMGKMIVECANECRHAEIRLGIARVTQDPKILPFLVEDSLDNLDFAKLKESMSCPVFIDFSVADAALKNAVWAAEHHIPIVIGTTGLSADALDGIRACAAKTAVLIAPNTSLGANLLAALAQIAAKSMPHSHCEIVDIHHQHKKDAPSGTAHFIANSIKAVRNDTCEILHPSRENGRKSNEIGMVSLRGGNDCGEHQVYFLGESERIILTHQAQNRRVFAQGALDAAMFLVSKQPGLYEMKDVLRM